MPGSEHLFYLKWLAVESKADSVENESRQNPRAAIVDEGFSWIRIPEPQLTGRMVGADPEQK